jgi:hypothetical protein
MKILTRPTPLTLADIKYSGWKARLSVLGPKTQVPDNNTEELVGSIVFILSVESYLIATLAIQEFSA